MTDVPPAGEPPRVVIAGGSGFLGTRLCRYLIPLDYDVVVLSRRRVAVPDGVSLIEWDGRTLGDWTSAVSGARAIVNLCGANIGAKRWSARRKTELRDSRITPGRLLAEAIRTASTPPDVLLQASGVGYYANGETERVESDPPGDTFLGHLAADWEAATDAVRCRRIVLRFGVVLGNDGGAFPAMAAPFRWFAGGRLASGEQWLSWIHLDDALRVILIGIERDALDGPLNVVSPYPVRNRSFTRTMARVLHRPAVLPAPRPALRLMLGERATLLVDGQRASADKLLGLGFSYRFPDIESALHDLSR